MQPDEVKSVGVVGAGIMGSGIVEVCAKAGLEVTFVEADEAARARGYQAIERSTAKAVERGKLDDVARKETLGRITASTNLKDLADADLVIEAVTEDLDTKLEVFRTLDELVKPDVVMATNTSSLPIAELSAATKRPDKVVGMHFFNPPPVMKLLEIVRALTTSYLNSAIRMLDEGFTSREDIDTAIQLGLGHPMGPLALLDLIGLDTALNVSQVLYDEFKDPLYSAPTLLKRMVSAGYLGRKSGRGFYEYEG